MRRPIASRITFGLCIIAVGVLVLGRVAFGWVLDDFARGWWTLFIIIPAVVGIVSEGLRFWNVFLLLLGLWLFTLTQHWWRIDTWPYFGGAALILLGVYVIVGGTGRHTHVGASSGRNFTQDSTDYPEYTSIFSNIKYANICKQFRGGKATSVFGNLTVDLREIDLTQTSVIEVTSVFGGLELLAPKNVPVKVNVVPVFGGFFNEANYSTPSPGQPFLEIRGASVFGGIRIL